MLAWRLPHASFLPAYLDILANQMDSSYNETILQTIFSDSSRDLVFTELHRAVKAFRETNFVKPHVLIANINENWGAFSDPIPNRTVNWGQWQKHWERRGFTMKDLWDYLNHVNVSAIFTTTHQNALPSPHPKVFPLPLGVKNAQGVSRQLHDFSMVNRTRLLLINMYNHSTRSHIMTNVIAMFNGTVRNLYKNGNYWEQLRESKFVLCPSGLGWDTYRSWEALIMGAIPVLERYYRQDGFYQAYNDLPVLWVDHYDNVTPTLLEQAYPKIMKRAKEYKFEKLTRQWWIDLVNSYRPTLQQ